MYGGAEKANAATSYKRALCDIQVFLQRPELFPCIFLAYYKFVFYLKS